MPTHPGSPADKRRGHPVYGTICLAALILLAASTWAQEEVIPNDPYFKWQMSYFNRGGQVEYKNYSISKTFQKVTVDSTIQLNLARAWGITKGSKDVIVAVIDDGFLYSHEDLQENIWANPGETGVDEFGRIKQANGVDDDGNGYIDDVMGWDFMFDDPDPDCYIFDGRLMTRIAPYFHGVDALGIIGARGNNGIGVAGINWEVSMMLLKTCAQGNTISKRAENTAKAIRYAVDNGARVINWSGGVSVTDSVQMKMLRESIDYAEEQGVLLVIGAGNSGVDLDLPENAIYPVCWPNENIVAVGEVDFDGTLYVVPEGSHFVGGSNYGVSTVDIAAIAQNYTTGIRQNVSIYNLGGGTSDATPVVAGVAALVYSIRPELTGADVKQILMQSSRKLPDLEGKIACGGMVDAYAALVLAEDWGR